MTYMINTSIKTTWYLMRVHFYSVFFWFHLVAYSYSSCFCCIQVRNFHFGEKGEEKKGVLGPCLVKKNGQRKILHLSDVEFLTSKLYRINSQELISIKYFKTYTLNGVMYHKGPIYRIFWSLFLIWNVRKKEKKTTNFPEISFFSPLFTASC